MELVDDDDIEVRRIYLSHVRAVEALDRCKDVVESFGPVARDPLLAKSCVTQRVPKGVATLVEDLFAMSDEQETCAGQPVSHSRVINCCHHRLSSSGCGDQQITVVPLVPRELYVLEQSLLKWP